MPGCQLGTDLGRPQIVDGLAKAGGSGLLRLAYPDRAAELGDLQGLAQHGTGRDDISLKKLVSAHQDDRNLRSSVIDHAH
jgi:hypothetical protein